MPSRVNSTSAFLLTRENQAWRYLYEAMTDGTSRHSKNGQAGERLHTVPIVFGHRTKLKDPGNVLSQFSQT